MLISGSYYFYLQPVLWPESRDLIQRKVMEKQDSLTLVLYLIIWTRVIAKIGKENVCFLGGSTVSFLIKSHSFNSVPSFVLLSLYLLCVELSVVVPLAKSATK